MRPKDIKTLAVRLYNLGYQSGHHDTVEGTFVHIHPVDLDSYHEDVVAEVLRDGLRDSTNSYEEPDLDYLLERRHLPLEWYEPRDACDVDGNEEHATVALRASVQECIDMQRLASAEGLACDDRAHLLNFLEARFVIVLKPMF